MYAMSKSRFNLTKRTALWLANGRRCFYCEEHVPFRDLEIEHVIAESTEEDRLTELVADLGLDRDFHINSNQNLVPTHRPCNRRKSGKELSEKSFRYYLEIWNFKQPDVQRELQRLDRQATNDKFLTAVGARIEKGLLSIQEAIAFLQNVAPSKAKTSEPLVVTFGVNVSDYIERIQIPAEDLPRYSDFCDELEEDLRTILRYNVSSVSVRTEASSKNGETLSVRMAFWSLDLSQLDQADIEPWEILELSPYSSVYDQEWDLVFPSAVVQTYNEVISDSNDTVFGLGRCTN